MKRTYGAAISAAIFAMAALGQDLAKQKLDDAVKQLKVELETATLVRTEGGVMSNVKNAPYRADQVTENTQTLGDGTRIHNERQIAIYRDSQGRVRRELPNEISIWDPNSGITFTLNPEKMTYRKMQVSVSSDLKAAKFASTGAGTVTFTTPSQTSGSFSMPLTVTVPGGGLTVKSADRFPLGTQMMEGVSAQGERQTSTIEAGAIGNDRPIQIVSERWYSPDLQLNVMTRHDDPRTGEEITRLINISRAEPDSSLFQVPAGYQLIEGKQLPANLKMKQ